GRRVQAVSEQRPARVTRSAVRRPGAGTAAGPSSPTKGAGGPSPNKIPRLAQASPSPPARSTTSMGTRTRLQAPTPSRLPTLVVNNRRANAAAGADAKAGEKGKEGKAADAWMKTNTAAVVVPGTKSERPGLRSVRRRRSSFSSADVVARVPCIL
ncbi:hypothetical protein EW145_g8475, partial [Phellinidium pouzarii]